MVGRIKTELLKLKKDESGASLLEYTILIGIITAGTVATVIVIGGWVGTQWTTLQTNLGL